MEFVTGASTITRNAGDRASAVDAFMRSVPGPGYRMVLDRALPFAFDQAVADADSFFGQEFPAIQQWSFRREDASRITQPVLAVIGEKSKELSPIWNERQASLLTWLPDAEPVVLPGATHLLHVENPRGMARGSLPSSRVTRSRRAEGGSPRTCAANPGRDICWLP